MLDTLIPIETARLILRRFVPDDLAAFHDYHRLPEVARYLYRAPRNFEQSRQSIAKAAAMKFEDEGDVLMLAVQNRKTSALLGEVVLKWARKDARQGEVGYIFSPAAEGHGYATEAARAMLALGFEHFNFHRIFGRCDALNTGSANVLKRLGMRQEAHLVESDQFAGRWGDELIFAMLKAEWVQRSGL